MSATVQPPKWAEAMLERLLPDADREPVIGDLREEYRERRETFPRWRADGWYWRQCAALSGWHWRSRNAVKTGMLVASALTMAVMSWLMLMEFVLHHPGFEGRIVAEGVVWVEAALAIWVAGPRVGSRWRSGVRMAAMLIFMEAVRTVFGVATAAHFEGYLLVASVIVIVQSAMAVTYLPPRPRAAIITHLFPKD